MSYCVVQNDGCDGKRAKKSGNKNDSTKGETVAEHSSGKDVEPTSEPPKQDYVHVRARRGQATDSHSLAERVISSFLIPTNYPFSHRRSV